MIHARSSFGPSDNSFLYRCTVQLHTVCHCWRKIFIGAASSPFLVRTVPEFSLKLNLPLLSTWENHLRFASIRTKGNGLGRQGKGRGGGTKLRAILSCKSWTVQCFYQMKSHPAYSYYTVLHCSYEYEYLLLVYDGYNGTILLLSPPLTAQTRPLLGSVPHQTILLRELH